MAKYKDPTTNEVIEVGTPELNPNLIAGKTQVPDTTPLGVINSSSLTSLTPENFKTASTPPVPDVSKLDTSITEMKATPQETQANDLTARLQAINDQLTGQSAFRSTQEAKQGLPELLKTQTDLSARLKGLQNEALSIPLQMQQGAEGRGITAGGLAPIQTGALRENAIKALSVSSMLEASRGNITLANDLVDRAVNAQYGPLLEEQKAKLANLDLILKSPAYSLADKNRANTQKAIEEAKKTQLEQAQKDKDEILKTVLVPASANVANFVSDGTPAHATLALTLDAISKAKTPQEALQIASANGLMVKKEAGFELSPGQSRYDAKGNLIVRAPEKGTPGAKAGASPELLLATSKANVDSIQNILNNGGLSISVGTSFLTKSQPGFFRNIGKIFTGVGAPEAIKGVYKRLTGEQQDFIASTEQVRSQLNLDKLIQSKAQGATFGALSDNELQVLASAGTKLGTWAIKDGDGNVVGYNASETAFKKEMDKVNNFAKLDYIIKGGNPADVGAKIMPDGAVWTANSDGTYTQIK